VVAEIERLAPSDLHRNPHARSRAGKGVVELLGAIPDAIVRYGYARLAADRLGVPAQLVWQRLGVGRESLSAALAPAEAAATTPGRRGEEEVLRALLVAAERGGELPPVAELPPPEAFLDPDLRKFFAVFRRLYEGGAAPGVRALLAESSEIAQSDEKAAQLLLESEDSPAPPLTEALKNLRRRWLRSRLRELNREISEAERRADRDRLAQLVDEKRAVNGELHGVDAPGAGLD